jgi:hypothetical protein
MKLVAYKIHWENETWMITDHPYDFNLARKYKFKMIPLYIKEEDLPDFLAAQEF